MKRILFLGDSVMFGSTQVGGVYLTAARTIPMVCGQHFGPSVTCLNHAIGGTTSAEWLYARGAVPITWEARMAACDADVVAINTGINDAFVPGHTPADHAWCYREFTRIARAAGKTMVFVSPNPINLSHNVQLWDLKHTVDGVAASLGVPVVNMYDAIAHGCPQWPAFLPDAVHPNQPLYEFMGHVAYMTLAPLLQCQR
jgi:lysophospholipase L1-like esterase